MAPPAAQGDLAAAERALGAPIPTQLRTFLESWDGALLFHESLVLYGVGRADGRRLARDVLARPGGRELPAVAFASTWAGETYLLPLAVQAGQPQQVFLRRDGDEAGAPAWLAGSSFAAWLDATLAHESVLFDSAGEYAEAAFDADGEDVTPEVQLRQAERAVRRDPLSALFQHELGTALRRLNKLERAEPALATAAELDEENPWPRFDLGRLRLAMARPQEAAADFALAAARSPVATQPRLWMFAARAHLLSGDEPARAAAVTRALALDPELPARLDQAARQALREADARAHEELLELAAALHPAPAARRRLPVLGVATPPPASPSAEAGRSPAAPRPRPAHAAARTGGARPAGRRPRAGR